MAKRIWPGLLALVLALSGCASLLERDYSVVESYADSYWDTEEDALRAESYQELVNSLLMLVEQRSEEGTIRFYTDSDAPYSQVVEASGRSGRRRLWGPTWWRRCPSSTRGLRTTAPSPGTLPIVRGRRTRTA